MPDLSLRSGLFPVTREDLPDLRRIEELCFPIPWSVESLSVLLTEPNVAFLCRQNGIPVGYGGMQCASDEGEITDIAVLPAFRRQGIATAILDALILSAKEQGVRTLFLEVRQSNLPAISLYRDKFGFETVGIRRAFYHQPREDAYCMRLILKDRESAPFDTK